MVFIFSSLAIASAANKVLNLGDATDTVYILGKLGVGNSNPGAKLDVNGAIKSTSATVTTLGANGDSFVMTGSDGSLYTEPGIKFKRTTVANVDYTAKVSDYIIAYTVLMANRTLTLSPCNSSNVGRSHIIANERGGTSYYVTVKASGSATISGMPSIKLPSYSSIPVYCNGVDWFIY